VRTAVDLCRSVLADAGGAVFLHQRVVDVCFIFELLLNGEWIIRIKWS